MKEFQKHFATGAIIKITNEPPLARRHGFLTGTEHTIVKPPENYVNSARAVWINNKKGEPTCINFYNYEWTGKSSRVRVKS